MIDETIERVRFICVKGDVRPEIMGALCHYLREALSSETTPTTERDKIIEECAHELDRQEQHINENAESLRKFPGEMREARARELGAMYVREAARTLRNMKSDSPMMKLLERL